MLSNGLGGTFHAWRHLYGHLAPHYRLVSWDFRGLHGSEAPDDWRDLTADHHVDDLEDLLLHLGIERAAFLGWSMGTQLNFELYRRRPEAFAALGIINGTAGRPFETLHGGSFARHFMPNLLRRLSAQGKHITSLTGLASQWKGLRGVLKRLGMVGRNIDPKAFDDLVVEFGRIDFGLYLTTLRLLGEHDAWDVLPGITVPTTIIVGEHDPMTPVRAAVDMSKAINDARLLVLPHCTHYTPLEEPDLVNRAIDNLLLRAGWGATQKRLASR